LCSWLGLPNSPQSDLMKKVKNYSQFFNDYVDPLFMSLSNIMNLDHGYLGNLIFILAYVCDGFIILGV
jgi:hypothetical protein